MGLFERNEKKKNSTFSGRIWAVISPDWFCVAAWSRCELEVHWGLCRSLRMFVSVHDGTGVLAGVLEWQVISRLPQSVEGESQR